MTKKELLNSIYGKNSILLKEYKIIEKIKKRIDTYTYLISITKNKKSIEQLKLIKQEFVCLLNEIRKEDIEEKEIIVERLKGGINVQINI